MRCEFVGGPDESASLTATNPSELGAEVLHAPLESSSSSSQSSIPATLPLFVRGKVVLRVTDTRPDEGERQPEPHSAARAAR